MKVWLEYNSHGNEILDVYLHEVTRSEAFTVQGAENMVLVDREELRHMLEHHGAAGARSNWCNWPDCGWSGDGTEHACPLREEV